MANQISFNDVQHATNEILTSEVDYWHYLSLIRYRFCSCLSLNPDVSLEDYRLIFDHLDPIHVLSGKFSTALRHKPSNIGQVFLCFLPFMRCYVPYVCKYPGAMRALEKLYNNSTVSADLRRLEESEDVNQRLAALLIMPIQRIPRYVLLLRKLLTFTESSHPDYAYRSEALERMSKFAMEINAKLDEEGKMEYLLTLYKCLQNKSAVEMIQPSRKFKRNGMVLQVRWNDPRNPLSCVNLNQMAPSTNQQGTSTDLSNDGTAELKPIFLILLSDVLLITYPLEKRFSKLLNKSSTSIGNNVKSLYDTVLRQEPIDHLGDLGVNGEPALTQPTFFRTDHPEKFFCEQVIHLDSLRVRAIRNIDMVSTRPRLCQSTFISSFDETVEQSKTEDSVMHRKRRHIARPISLYSSFSPHQIKHMDQLNPLRLFKLSTPDGSLILYASDEKECFEWIQSIRDTSFECCQRRNTLRLNDTSGDYLNSPVTASPRKIQKKANLKRKHVGESVRCPYLAQSMSIRNDSTSLEIDKKHDVSMPILEPPCKSKKTCLMM